jgi:hypothetical protein
MPSSTEEPHTLIHTTHPHTHPYTTQARLQLTGRASGPIPPASSNRTLHVSSVLQPVKLPYSSPATLHPYTTVPECPHTTNRDTRARVPLHWVPSCCQNRHGHRRLSPYVMRRILNPSSPHPQKGKKRPLILLGACPPLHCFPAAVSGYACKGQPRVACSMSRRQCMGLRSGLIRFRRNPQAHTD